MIRESAAELAGVIGPAVAPVPCTDHPPDTVAGPALWLELSDVSHSSAGWVVAHTVWVVAGDALTGKDAANMLGDLTDAVLAAVTGANLAAPRDIRAVAQPARIGDLGHPAVAITVPTIMCKP